MPFNNTTDLVGRSRSSADDTAVSDGVAVCYKIPNRACNTTKQPNTLQHK